MGLALIAASWLGLLRSTPALGREAWPEAEDSEPRLILAGNRVVEPGQWIDLRWTAADSISEFEILLSQDGGRTYAECISPQLDPRRHNYVWRVPPLAGKSLRMRIRFNRRGREIEGSPTAPLVVLPGGPGRPQPLALPPLAEGGDERTPRPSSRGTAPCAWSPLGEGNGSEQSEACGPRSAARISSSSGSPARSSVAALPGRFIPPRALPLRI